MYNAITRSAEAELVPTLRRFGLDWVVYNPLAGGVLSGKIKSKDVPTEGRFSDTAKSGALYRQRYFKDATFEALKILEPVMEQHKIPLAEAAFRWLVHHSQLRLANQRGNDGILIGVSSQQQLEQNIQYLEAGPLPQPVIDALDQAWKVIGGSAPPYWHKALEYEYDTHEALYGNGAL